MTQWAEGTMDGRSFDDLARLIGTGTSRRRVLGALAGGLAGLH
jgi:hypothetical protein